MTRISARRVGFFLAFFLAVGALLFSPAAPSPRGRSGPLRLLLGPVATLAADIQWIRYRAARDEGAEARAILLARSAVDLDPGRTDGWRVLAAHLALDLASPEHESDRARRARWFLAGIELTRAGQAAVRDPGELALWRGLLYLSRLDVDPDLLEGGSAELSRRAEDAFREAACLGSADARSLIGRNER